MAKPNPFEVYSPLEGELFLRSQHPDVYLVGVDEAGRGPLAGPVVAAAVILPPDFDLPGLNDSKKLTEAKREVLFPLIQQHALAWAIAEASAAEIDQINILQADFLAMRRALQAIGWLGLRCQSPAGETRQQVWSSGVSMVGDFFVAVDGNLKISDVGPAQQLPVIKGDAHVASIAAASILAKVHRDRALVKMDLEYPQYGFAKHKGYPSPTHLEAMRQFGLCPEHRRSFKPKALDDLDLFGSP